MTTPQILISGILVLAMIMFGWGKYRYDLVAMRQRSGLCRFWQCRSHHGCSSTDYFNGFEKRRGCRYARFAYQPCREKPLASVVTDALGFR